MNSDPVGTYLSGLIHTLYLYQKTYFSAPRAQLNFVVYLSPHRKSSQTEPVTFELYATLLNNVLPSRVYLNEVDLYFELL